MNYKKEELERIEIKIFIALLSHYAHFKTCNGFFFRYENPKDFVLGAN